MATFLPGITDYIPQVQPWQPDLSFYQGALQRKQSQYDAAYNKLSSMYGSLLNSSMLRDSNIKRREDFFKAIDNDIKRISTLDLSLQQNQDAAMELFRPFYEDENIIVDMAWTRKLNNQMQRGQSFKGCTDPKKCNGQYWDGGMQYLNYMAEEFKNATDEEALRFRSPEFIPAQNVTKDLIDFAFKNKLQINTVNNRGGFLVTESNGRQAYLPLTDMFRAYMGNNADVAKYFEAQGYLDRKRYADENAYRFQGDKNQAEMEYIQKTIADSEKILGKQNSEAQKNNQYLKTKAGAIANHIENNGTTPTSDLAKELKGIIGEIQQSNEIVKHTKGVAELYNGIGDLGNDIGALRDRADRIKAGMLFRGEVFMAAKSYADTTYKEKKEANPYALENYKFKNQVALNDKKFQQQVYLKNLGQKYEKENIYLKALAKQVGAENIKKDSKSQFAVQGPAELNEFTALGENESASTSTGTEGIDVRQETLTKFKENFDDVEKLNADLLQKSLMYLQNQATSSGDDGLAAKNELQKILGKNYDAKTNEFKNAGGLTIKSVEDFVDPNKVNTLANTTLAVIKSNPLYKSFYKSTVSGIERQVTRKKDLQNAYLDMYTKSNNNIRTWAKSSNTIDEDEKEAFDLLFDKSGALKTKNEYISAYNTKFDDDDGEDMYEDMFEKYQEIYKTGALQNPGSPKIVMTASGLPGASIFAEGVTGKTSAGGKAKFNGLFSSSVSNLGIISYTNNATDAGRAKAVFGNDITQDDYEDMEDDQKAFSLFKAISNDLEKGNYKARDKYIPTGSVYYRGIAANDPNLVAVTIVPDAEYLGKFVKSKKNPGGIIDEGDIEEAVNGITVFMDRSKAVKNKFYDMSKQGDLEVIAASGRSIPVKIENTADLSFSKENGKNVARGFIYQNYVDENGNFKTKTLNASNIGAITTDLDTYVNNLEYQLAKLQQQNDYIKAEYEQKMMTNSINDIINYQSEQQTGNAELNALLDKLDQNR